MSAAFKPAEAFRYPYVIGWPGADVFVPGLPPLVPFARNAVLRFDEDDMHHALARELLIRLHDIQSTACLLADYSQGFISGW